MAGGACMYDCYGCPLWDVTSKHIARFYTSWRKSVRKLFDPYRTHCNLLPIVTDSKPIEYARTAKFICGAISSQNTYLKKNVLMDIVTPR